MCMYLGSLACSCSWFVPPRPLESAGRERGREGERGGEAGIKDGVKQPMLPAPHTLS